LSGLGSIAIAKDCFIRIVDYASFDGLWEPAMKAYRAAQPTETLPAAFNEMIEVMKAMPRVIHAHFLAPDTGLLWSSLEPGGLMIPRDDLTLKHGGTISGRWQALYVLDTDADDGAPPDTENWSSGDVGNGLLLTMHALKTFLGRPSTWLGITPLMIFRDIAG
jgi:hypothetical protein